MSRRTSVQRALSFVTTLAGACALVVVVGPVAAGADQGDRGGGGVNARGNILIADQFNNRVVEINRNHQVVWQFGNGSAVAGPHSVVGTNDAQRVGPFTLISGTGTPAGADPSCTNPNGCLDNRVFFVAPDGKIIWQYGQTGVAGSGP